MSWWRRNWRWLLTILVSTGGMLVVGILYGIRRERAFQDLRAKLALSRAASEVKGLKADRTARREELRINKLEAARLDREINEARRKAVAVVSNVEGLSDVEVAREFKKLGF